MKVGRVKDPLYKDSYLGITPPTFTPPLEPFEGLGLLFMCSSTAFRARLRVQHVILFQLAWAHYHGLDRLVVS